MLATPGDASHFTNQVVPGRRDIPGHDAEDETLQYEWYQDVILVCRWSLVKRRLMVARPCSIDLYDPAPWCLREQADFIRHEGGYRQAFAPAASQAEFKIVDSGDL